MKWKWHVTSGMVDNVDHIMNTTIAIIANSIIIAITIPAIAPTDRPDEKCNELYVRLCIVL